MATLVLNSPSGEATRIPITKIRTTIGRSARNDVCIVDAFASRLHAEIRRDGEIYWLNDLGSANGTRVNGIPVSSPVKLLSGAEIVIGENKLVFEEIVGSETLSAKIISSDTGILDPAKTVSFPVMTGTQGLVDRGTSSRGDLLALINKVGLTLLSASGLDETLNQVASLVFDSVPAERCVIMLKTIGGAGGLEVAVALERGKPAPMSEIRISGTVLEEVLSRRNAVLTSDAQSDPRYASETMMLLGIRSVLAVPLCTDGAEVFGLVYADSPTSAVTFTQDHLNILTTLASVAAIRVENARLTEARIHRERMERELALATEIQQRFQPCASPYVKGFEFQGASFPCYEIGGDYYDFIERTDGRILIALGDVSGKGTAAALLMSSVHAAMHAQVAADQPLANIPCRLNEYLANNTPSNRFVTLFVAELNPNDGCVDYVNAGHNPPLLLRTDGTIEELASGGPPLGLISEASYETGRAVLAPGEIMVIYSDGVTEATDLEGVEFGTTRLKSLLSRSVSESAPTIRDRIEAALSTFTASAPATDDITLVIVKRVL